MFLDKAYGESANRRPTGTATRRDTPRSARHRLAIRPLSTTMIIQLALMTRPGSRVNKWTIQTMT